MLCNAEIEGYLRESNHGVREGVQDKQLLAPLGHRGDMFETAEERSKNGYGKQLNGRHQRDWGGLSSSSSSSLSFLLWCCHLYGYWHVDTQRDQSTSDCCIASIISFVIVIVVVIDFIARIAVSVIANRTCQCLALLLLSAQGEQTSRHLCPSSTLSSLSLPSLRACVA